MTDVTLFIVSSIKKAALKWAAVKRTAFAKKTAFRPLSG
jgi:hypothetical protein